MMRKKQLHLYKETGKKKKKKECGHKETGKENQTNTCHAMWISKISGLDVICNI